MEFTILQFCTAKVPLIFLRGTLYTKDLLRTEISWELRFPVLCQQSSASAQDKEWRGIIPLYFSTHWLMLQSQHLIIPCSCVQTIHVEVARVINKYNCQLKFSQQLTLPPQFIFWRLHSISLDWCWIVHRLFCGLNRIQRDHVEW